MVTVKPNRLSSSSDVIRQHYAAAHNAFNGFFSGVLKLFSWINPYFLVIILRATQIDLLVGRLEKSYQTVNYYSCFQNQKLCPIHHDSSVQTKTRRTTWDVIWVQGCLCIGSLWYSRSSIVGTIALWERNHLPWNSWLCVTWVDHEPEFLRPCGSLHLQHPASGCQLGNLCHVTIPWSPE